MAFNSPHLSSFSSCHSPSLPHLFPSTFLHYHISSHTQRPPVSALTKLCPALVNKCQVSSLSFFPPHPIPSPLYLLLQTQVCPNLRSQRKTGLNAASVYFLSILYLSLLKSGCPCFGFIRL